MHPDTNSPSQAQSQASAGLKGGQQGCCGQHKGDCYSGVAPIRALPTTLAGYQAVVSGRVKEGDIWVSIGIPIAYVSDDIVGLSIDDMRCCSPVASLYRKMPCATNLDHEYPDVKGPEHEKDPYESWTNEAKRLVLTDRNDTYGNPREDFEGTAKMWSGLLSEYLNKDLDAPMVALMMTALKLRREAHKHKPDNIVDAHGYLLTHEWIVKGRKPV